MNRLVYYIVYAISLLPLWVLYIFSDLFYFLLISILPYRKAVIIKNLKASFPNSNKKELNKLKKEVYRHFSDLLIEGIKNLSISKDELKKRFVVSNPELMDSLYKQNKSVLLVSGHYNNWEWMISSQAFLFSHQAMGIGMPLSNGFWDKKINNKRARFGMDIAHAKNYKEKIKTYKDKPLAILTLSDQSPGNSLKSFWTTFLNQPTAVLFGIEMMAHEYQYELVFYKTRKIKRGYYEIELVHMNQSTKNLKWGDITKWHTKQLENLIIENPAYWLWTHKRWKREVPENLEKLKNEQQELFEKKFHSH